MPTATPPPTQPTRDDDAIVREARAIQDACMRILERCAARDRALDEFEAWAARHSAELQALFPGDPAVPHWPPDDPGPRARRT